MGCRGFWAGDSLWLRIMRRRRGRRVRTATGLRGFGPAADDRSASSRTPAVRGWRRASREAVTERRGQTSSLASGSSIRAATGLRVVQGSTAMMFSVHPRSTATSDPYRRIQSPIDTTSSGWAALLVTARTGQNYARFHGKSMCLTPLSGRSCRKVSLTSMVCSANLTSSLHYKPLRNENFHGPLS